MAAVNDHWWNNAYDALAAQLPASVLACLRERVERTRVKGRVCTLDEASDVMRELFERMINSYTRKKIGAKARCRVFEARLAQALEEQKKASDERERALQARIDALEAELREHDVLFEREALVMREMAKRL